MIMDVMYGLQFDSAVPLPFVPALQARYINGAYASFTGYGRGRVYIDVTGGAPDKAMWLDVERFDATPATVPDWLDDRASYSEGGIYCSRDNLAAVETAAGDRPHLLWVATLDGTLDVQLPPGAGHLVAVQAVPAAMLGIKADVSLVTDPAYWAAHALGA